MIGDTVTVWDTALSNRRPLLGVGGAPLGASVGGVGSTPINGFEQNDLNGTGFAWLVSLTMICTIAATTTGIGTLNNGNLGVDVFNFPVPVCNPGFKIGPFTFDMPLRSLSKPDSDIEFTIRFDNNTCGTWFVLPNGFYSP